MSSTAVSPLLLANHNAAGGNSLGLPFVRLANPEYTKPPKKTRHGQREKSNDDTRFDWHNRDAA